MTGSRILHTHQSNKALLQTGAEIERFGSSAHRRVDAWRFSIIRGRGGDNRAKRYGHKKIITLAGAAKPA